MDSQEVCTNDPGFLAKRHMAHLSLQCLLFFQKMDAIKRKAQAIKKVGIEMTGLSTLTSIGDVMQEKLKMVHDINEELVTNVYLIVDYSAKMNRNQ